MSTNSNPTRQVLPRGVMLNAYPDSIGGKLSDLVGMLKRPELEDAFSLLYILPTFFNSDLDRGFSIIDYGLNDELVSRRDLQQLDKLGILFKFDLILNHLSVASPQFQDLLKYGDDSEYKDFFIDWNAFWHGYGRMGDDGCVIPDEAYLRKLFMRKPGLPILKVRFPDGSDRPYWNTFYQQIIYRRITPGDLDAIDGLTPDDAETIAAIVNDAIEAGADPDKIDLTDYAGHKNEILAVVERKREYLGQMDLNARSERVWEFYDQTFARLRGYGAKIIRLDAFAYLHKQPGEANFFNKPGTWEYLARLKDIARKHELIIFPEIHAEYGKGLHREVADQGYPIYDFFFPGLVIDALNRGTNAHLLRWIREVTAANIETINMLGCHDGIPVLDLGGADVDGLKRPGLLQEDRIQAVMARIIDRGGRVKNLYGADGRKIAYYQVNATFFSALGEDDRKLLLARAIQLFMPGIPQVWYLDLFAGKNDYAAADKGGTAGHKEINRTNLTMDAIREGLMKPVVQDQLKLIRLRNTSPAFHGELRIAETADHLLELSWRDRGWTATLTADLRESTFTITHQDDSGTRQRMPFL